MPGQFKIKNGLIVDNGGIQVTGSISSTAGITGSFSGSIAGFPTDVAAFSSSLSSRLSSNEAKTGSFATTGSNQFSGSQTITGSLTTTGTITAQTLVVQTITSSVEFVTGSNRFGSTTGNTHEFTGSLLVSGAASFANTVSAANGTLIGGTLVNNYIPRATSTNAITSSFIYHDSFGAVVDTGGNNSSFTVISDDTAQLTIRGGNNYGLLQSDSSAFVLNTQVGITGNDLLYYDYSSGSLALSNTGGGAKLIIKSNGNVGIGTTNPTSKLEVAGDITAHGAVTLGSGYSLSFKDPGTTTYARIEGSSYNSSYSYLAFYTGGDIEHMRVTSAGSVGIGISTPSTRLHVSSISGSANALAPPALGFANSSSVALFTNYDAAYGTLFGTTNAGNGWIQQQRVDGTGTAYALTLQPTSGNVGIGTLSPGYKLDVSGTGRFTGDLVVTGSITISGANSINFPNSKIKIGPSATATGNDVVAIGYAPQATGNNTIAIGYNPRTQHVNTAVVSNNSIAIGYNPYAGGNNSIAIGYTAKTYFGNSINIGDAYFASGSNAWITGSFGVGTNSPNSPLDVTSATTDSSGIQQWSYNGNPSSYRLQLNTIVSSGLVKYSFDLTNNSTAYNNNLVLTNGLVGIGTSSPASRLDINGGSIRMGEYLNNASSYIGKQRAANGVFYSSVEFYSTSGEDTIIFNTHLSGTSSGERMRIMGSGNVGIGVTNPSSKLDVNGDVASLTGGFRSNKGTNATVGQGSNFYLDGSGGYTMWQQTGTNKTSWFQYISGGWGEKMYLDNGSLTTTGNITAGGTLTENSSLRYKENIETLTSSLDKVTQMRGVSYNKKDTNVKEIGVIAEEINEILPYVVIKNENGEPDSVSYGRLTAILIEVIKELKAEINVLKSK